MPTVGGGSTWVEQENFNQIESAINQLQISVNDLSYQVGRILSALDKGQTPNALTIDVTNQQILAKDGTLIMSGIANVTSNLVRLKGAAGLIDFAALPAPSDGIVKPPKPSVDHVQARL